MAKRLFTGMASAVALMNAGGAAQACDQHGGFGFSASFYEYYAALEEAAAGEQQTLEAYNEKLKTDARARFVSRFNVQPLQQEASAADANASEETFQNELADNDKPDA